MQDKDMNEKLRKIEDLKAVFSFGGRFLPFLEALLLFARETSPLLDELSESLRVSSGAGPEAGAGPETAGSLLSRLDEIDSLFLEVSRRLSAEREVIGEITEGIEKLLKLPEARKKLSALFEDQQAREIGVKIKAAVDGFLGGKTAESVAEKAGRLLQEARSEAVGLQSAFQAQGSGQAENSRALLSSVRARLDDLLDKYPGAGLPDFIAESGAGPAGRIMEEELEITAADSPPAMQEHPPAMLQSETEMPESKAFEEEGAGETAALLEGEIPEEIPEELPEEIEAEGGAEANQEELDQLLDWGADLDTAEVAAEPAAEAPEAEAAARGEEPPTLDEQIDAEAEAAEKEAGRVVGEVEQSIEELLGETAAVEEEPVEEALEVPVEAVEEAVEEAGEVVGEVEELFEEKSAVEEKPAEAKMGAVEKAAGEAEEMTEEVRKSVEDLFEDSAGAASAPAEEPMEEAAGAAEVDVSVDDLFADTAAAEEQPAEKPMEAPPEAAVEEAPPKPPAKQAAPEPLTETVEEAKPVKGGKKASARKTPSEEPGDKETEAELSISQEEIDKLFQ